MCENLSSCSSLLRMFELPAPPSVAWVMPSLVRGSIGVHLLAAGAAAAMPQHAVWALAGVAANHAVLTAAGLLPRARLLGPNMSRLSADKAALGEICLTIDDGPDPEVTPAVLDMLEAQQMRAVFFCIAERAVAHPALTREIVARGHSVQNHSYLHRHNFSLLGLRGYGEEISRAQQALFDVTGIWPQFFRAPAGLRNPFLDPVLHRMNLRLVSWTRRGYDTRENQPQRVLQRLTHRFAGGDILLLHDGHAARSAQGRPIILEVLPKLAAAARQAGLQWAGLSDAPAGAAANLARSA